MIDCAECGSQLWRVLDDDAEIIRFICTYCNLTYSFALTEKEMGYDCFCSNDTWNIQEKREDHVILSCTSCNELAEVWLRESEN